jgi:hypothetical protein
VIDPAGPCPAATMGAGVPTPGGDCPTLGGGCVVAEGDGLTTVADGDRVGLSAGDVVWNGATLADGAGLALTVRTVTDLPQPDAARTHAMRTAKNVARRTNGNFRGYGQGRNQHTEVDAINIPKYMKGAPPPWGPRSPTATTACRSAHAS